MATALARPPVCHSAWHLALAASTVGQHVSQVGHEYILYLLFRCTVNTSYAAGWCEVIGELIKHSAKLIGEPIKRLVKLAFCTALMTAVREHKRVTVLRDRCPFQECLGGDSVGIPVLKCVVLHLPKLTWRVTVFTQPLPAATARIPMPKYVTPSASSFPAHAHLAPSAAYQIRVQLV